MQFNTKTAVLVTTASSTQDLSEDAAYVVSVVGLAGGATSVAATSYTVQTAAPATDTEVQFTGTPQDPSPTLTFDEELAADGLLLVTYVPIGAIPAAR